MATIVWPEYGGMIIMERNHCAIKKKITVQLPKSMSVKFF